MHPIIEDTILSSVCAYSFFSQSVRFMSLRPLSVRPLLIRPFVCLFVPQVCNGVELRMLTKGQKKWLKSGSPNQKLEDGH